MSKDVNREGFKEKYDISFKPFKECTFCIGLNKFLDNEKGCD